MYWFSINFVLVETDRRRVIYKCPTKNGRIWLSSSRLRFRSSYDSTNSHRIYINVAHIHETNDLYRQSFFYLSLFILQIELFRGSAIFAKFLPMKHGSPRSAFRHPTPGFARLFAPFHKLKQSAELSYYLFPRTHVLPPDFGIHTSKTRLVSDLSNAR